MKRDRDILDALNKAQKELICLRAVICKYEENPPDWLRSILLQIEIVAKIHKTRLENPS